MDRTAFRTARFTRLSADFRAGIVRNCSLATPFSLHYSRRPQKHLMLGELPNRVMRLAEMLGL
jgi:hypothetical protein